VDFNMEIKLHYSWNQIISSEFDKPYFIELTDFVNKEYSLHKCFPDKNQIFNAFNLCQFDLLKVVIIGQDPYHGLGQANGLCFSVNDDVKIPHSLNNIFKELENDLAISYTSSGNLERWAKQGVLLLNATLSVRQGQAGSHQGKGWETFTDSVIQKISENKENVVFILWGGSAKKKGLKIDRSKHYVLESGHPSPLSANKGLWFGNKHFSKTNDYLISKGIDSIIW